MQSLDWYAPSNIPACRVHIRARLLSGQEVSVAGHFDRQGLRVWYVLDGRALRPLTSPIRCWQPLSDAWKWPFGAVPTPLASELSSVASADLVRVMEEDRKAPGPDLEQPPAGQWWRDVDLVRYEEPGVVSVRHGEARLMRAIAMDRSIRMDGPSHRSQMAALAALRQSLADVLRETPELDWIPPLRPLPQDDKDYLTAMGWLVEIAPTRRQMRILLARARTPPVTYEFVGDMLRISAARAHQTYEATVARTVAAANGDRERTRRRLAAIQERNREARR